jgi:hypothetical protein
MAGIFTSIVMWKRGRTYCYRILAKFARVSQGGYPYNVVESLASEEVCAQLPRDLPLITNVSVEATDVATGKMKIVWSKPLGGGFGYHHQPWSLPVPIAPGARVLGWDLFGNSGCVLCRQRILAGQ